MKSGALIRRIREAAGLTQPELAFAAATSDRTIRDWELGKKLPREKVRDRVVKALQEERGCSADGELSAAIAFDADRVPYGRQLENLELAQEISWPERVSEVFKLYGFSVVAIVDAEVPMFLASRRDATSGRRRTEWTLVAPAYGSLEGVLAAAARLLGEYQEAEPTIDGRVVLFDQADSTVEDTVREAGLHPVYYTELVRGVLQVEPLIDAELRSLDQDARYKPDCFIDQRLRLHDAEGFPETALAAVRRFLDDDDARFLLVLGDYGLGKSFLLREVFRECAAAFNEDARRPAPVLVNLARAERPNLEALVGSPFARHRVPYNPAAVDYLLREGGLIVLFDAFDVVGVGSEIPDRAEAARFRRKHHVRRPFALYVGRIDENKGCRELFAYFQRYAAMHPRGLDLVLIGSSVLSVPSHPRIRHLGFLPDQDKFDALAAADVLVMPSRYESLSMVALEAWAMGRPVLANGACDVLRGQCIRSGAGLYYDTFPEFAEALYQLEATGPLGGVLGRRGREFFRRHYTWPVIERKYLDMLAGLTREPAPRLDPLPGFVARRSRTLPPAAAVVAAAPSGAVLS